MKKRLTVILVAAFLQCCFMSCNQRAPVGNEAISGDSATIAKGGVSFNQYCSGCHNFSRNGIGPQLGGLTSAASADWISRFVKDPQALISAGDERAQQLYKKYKVVMPSFAGLTDDQLKQIISFIHIHKSVASKTKKNGNEMANPFPDTIQSSNIVVALQQVTQFPASSDSGKLPLARITKLDFQPKTGSLFVADLNGKLYQLHDGKPHVYMDMAQLKPAFIRTPGLATGLGSFAFHPQFASNGLIYTTHTEPAGTAKADFGYADSIKVTLQWVLTEWKADHPGAAVFAGKGREVLRVNMVSAIHGVQEIAFNPVAKPGSEDYGLLYMGVGDGGCVENGYPFLAHSREKIWGTILRIDPAGRNSANRQYGIPTQNPFAKGYAKELGEIYAYGFRNPHRITWTRKGEMLACNIGQTNIESINLIRKGGDYGWPIREGNFVADPSGDLDDLYPLTAGDSSFHITYPVAEYDHDEGKAISGGFEYGGSAIPQLKGKYVFGDIPSGRLFFINLADMKQGKQAVIKEWHISVNGAGKRLTDLCGSTRVDLHFGKDNHGEMYVLTKADGRMYKLISAVANARQ